MEDGRSRFATVVAQGDPCTQMAGLLDGLCAFPESGSEVEMEVAERSKFVNFEVVELAPYAFEESESEEDERHKRQRTKTPCSRRQMRMNTNHHSSRLKETELKPQLKPCS